ncbi:hypothetical protein BOTBODRAFT_159106 [Botryobasidium botryosum FD-172 SS1]|uniref:Cytochrome P450 n=1 Tax=Botryobasidium botryosum (strain FD-172 SS1) TaxID=930990 RepID=A0A067MFT5_BOTB1|nr:hypothetical protein BOTBODRAFT_159106 [Botryobasidium botryosum FD-172 SS1]
MTTLLLVSTLLGLFAAVAFYYFNQISRASNPRRLPYPPGPVPEFLIGNARQIPAHSSWLQYTEWKKTIGDIVHLEALGNHIVVLNTYKTARDLLDLRSSAYADRPTSWMIGELMGWARVASSCPYNETWRRYRKLMHTIIHKGAIQKYHPWLERDARVCLSQLLESPERFLEHVRLFAGKVTVMFTYGIEVRSSGDRLITIAEEAIDKALALAYPGAAFVDIFPPLRHIPSWFPGATFKRNAKIWRKMGDTMVEEPFNRVKADMAAGTAIPSFTSDCLESGQYSDKDVMWCAGSMYGAGADTMLSSLGTLFLAMAMFPDAQKKAQVEIDKFVRAGTLPTFVDRTSLPYVECLVKELHRWRPPTPLAVPHSLTEDDYYDGYYIPKGSIVMPNIWAISQDEENYKDPKRFWPERFEDPETAELDPSKYVFGFGRRACAGVHFADAAIFIMVVSILAMFEISEPKEEGESNLCLADVRYTTGLISRPEPFQCIIRPRSDAAARLIRAAVVG